MKDYRKSAVILAFGLVVLTVLACLPYAPQGPFDAGNYTRPAGMRVEQHLWTAPIEPLFAPLKIVAGAPNFAVAGIVTLIWVFLGAAAWGMFTEFRAKREKKLLSILGRGIWSALVATTALGLLLFFFVMARVPGWRLIVHDPNLIVADLHSHTIISHDGLVSMRTNLNWHASCGYDVAGLTEHDNLVDHKIHGAGSSDLDRLPAFFSGVEVHTVPRAMVLGVCRDPGIKLGTWVHNLALFAKRIHRDCGGAVIVVTLKNLLTGDIARLADEGADAFEIANCGHPGLPPNLRRQVLAVCRSRGLPLVADTDWHGWTGLTRTWNVIRAPGARGLSPSQRADLVLRKLRDHDSADIIPVVAGYMGEPSRARAIFSPIVETVRYAMELSAVRVISWWIWAWAIFMLWVFIERNGFSAGGILPALLVWATGLGLIFAGISVIRQGTGSTGFGFHAGLITIAVGAAALVISTLRGVYFLTSDIRAHREFDLARNNLLHR